MRILIADDEKLVRFSLINMLQELDPGNQIIGEAQNGREMIDMTKKYQPDVVFVDIQMPKINGLEALKTLKKDFPEVEWIMLTGHSEFKYVQEALKLGAADYLLKPASPEEIQEVLNKFKHKKRKNLLIKNRDFEGKINYHFNSMASGESEQWPIITMSHFQGALIVFDSSLTDKAKAAFRLDFCQTLRGIIDTTQAEEIRTAFFCLSDGTLAVAAAYGFSAQVESAKRMIIRLFGRIENAALEKGGKEHFVTILKTGECSSLSCFQASLENLNELLFLRFVTGINRAASHQALAMANESYQSRTIARYLDTISNAVQMGSIPKIGETLSSLCSTDLRNLDVSLQKNITDTFRLLFNFDITELTACEWVDAVKDTLFQKVKEENRDNNGLVQQVVRFMKDKYMENISISDIAENLNLTPNYLSTIFHQKSGTTFLKYLTGLRIKKAEELLLETDMKVQDIAGLVGYANTKYFAKAFKKLTDCTPSEYKKNGKV